MIKCNEGPCCSTALLKTWQFFKSRCWTKCSGSILAVFSQYHHRALDCAELIVKTDVWNDVERLPLESSATEEFLFFYEAVTFSNLPALQPGSVSLSEPSEKVTLRSQNTWSFATCSGVMKSTNLSWRRLFTVAPLLLPRANQQGLFSFPLLKHKQEVGPLVTCFVQRFYCSP